MVLVIATAGLVYELALGAVASYVLGDSIRQFSLVIGVYLSALGAGAYVSRFADRHLSITFVDVELAAALVGGFSAPLLLLCFGYTGVFEIALYAVVVTTGTLVGVELPLLIRILEKRLTFRELIARALTFDYAGALVGSLAFTFVLVPRLGLAHTSLACGLLNATVALLSTWVLPTEDEAESESMRAARVRAWIVLLLLLLGVAMASRLVDLAERAAYPGPIEIQRQSPYQRIVLTNSDSRFELFLDGHLQFSSTDEHRYHEMLVHPALAATRLARRVLIGGGGDGLAAREVLRWSDVQEVTLVDLDREVTDLSRSHAALSRQNRGSLDDPRVHVINADAMEWLRTIDERFDVVILDFPDPSHFAIGKLYSDTFYKMVSQKLTPEGSVVVQASSPFFGRHTFWCIVTTLESAGFTVRPYHAYIPSFGDWGFALAKLRAFEPPLSVPIDALTFLNDTVLRSAFHFAKDTARVPTRPNRLNNQALVTYYLDEWKF